MKSKMFGFVTKTSNAIYGCHHGCVYCFARRLAETKLANTPKYAGHFNARFDERELRRRFPAGSFVFVSDMGDAFGDWVPAWWIIKVLEWCHDQPEVTFLLLTKNPKRYVEFLEKELITKNCILGATIESNRNYPEISKASPQTERIFYMASVHTAYPDFRTFISVEPILDFDLPEFENIIIDLEPWGVAIGYDNYGNHLPEPPLDKTMSLYECLRKYTEVFGKTLRDACPLE